MTPVIPAGGDRDLRAELLPSEILPWFDDRFVRSCDLIEEYVHRLALEIARSAGLEDPLREGGTPETIAHAAGFDPGAGPSLCDWVMRALAERRVLEREPSGVFRLHGPLPEKDPDETFAEQEAHDPTALPSYRLARIAAAAYPSVMRGEIAGEAALFAADRIASWGEYFSNANPLYAIANAIGAEALAVRFPHPRGTVLEVGGGFGSGASAVLDRLAVAGATGRLESYRFTEISPLFLRRGQRSLAARPDARGRVTFGTLDIDRPFAEAGIEPGTVSVVYGVNTLHVARDLPFTLREIRRALAPGGLVLAAECMRPFAGQTVYVELVFVLLEAFRRPGGGFLTPEEWGSAFDAAGFAEPFVWPDLAAIRPHYPSFVVAATGATRR
jgi:SAM-dependent methyltransferase